MHIRLLRLSVPHRSPDLPAVIQDRMRNGRGGERKCKCPSHSERDRDVDGGICVVRGFINVADGSAGEDGGDVVWQSKAIHDGARRDRHVR